VSPRRRHAVALERLRVIISLGSFAWDGVLRALTACGNDVGKPKPKFGHDAWATIGRYTLAGSFHPSQQNTFTGKLTPAMLDAVFQGVRALL
jgi:uracil-DNA glycosylase